MTKTATKRAIRSLPALRTSLIWFKCQTIRDLQRHTADASSPRLAAVYVAKIAKVRTMDLASLRQDYLNARVAAIRMARRAELSQAIPGIVWMSAETAEFVSFSIDSWQLKA